MDPSMDDEIGTLLRRSAGEAPSVDAGLAAVTGRARVARRRRTAARLSAFSALAAMIGAAALLVGPHGQGRQIDMADAPAHQGDDPVPTSIAPSPTMTATASATTDDVELGGPAVTSRPAVSTSVDGATAPTVAQVATTAVLFVPSTSAPIAVAPPSTATERTTPSTAEPGPPSSTAASTTRPAELFTYPLAGGTTVVSWDGVRLVLVSTTPAAGYTVAVDHAEPLEIELRYVSGGRSSVLHVAIEAGQPVLETSG